MIRTLSLFLRTAADESDAVYLPNVDTYDSVLSESRGIMSSTNDLGFLPSGVTPVAQHCVQAQSAFPTTRPATQLTCSTLAACGSLD